MTPEEIILNFIQARLDAKDDLQMYEAKLFAIEAIKAYAREMCDKQKEECEFKALRIIPKADVCLAGIRTALYPKELL
jgi:hypothetical protein